VNPPSASLLNSRMTFLLFPWGCRLPGLPAGCRTLLPEQFLKNG
jgi:hypothetical protein